MSNDQIATYYSRLAKFHTRLAEMFQSCAANPDEASVFALPIQMTLDNIKATTNNMVMALEIEKMSQQQQESNALLDDLQKRLEAMRDETAKNLADSEAAAPQESAG